MLVHLDYYWPWRARLCLPAWLRRMCVSMRFVWLCVCLLVYVHASLSLSLVFFSRYLTINFPQDALDVALIEEAPEGLHSSKCTTGTRLGLRVSRRPFPWPEAPFFISTGELRGHKSRFPKPVLYADFLFYFDLVILCDLWGWRQFRLWWWWHYW